MSSGDREITSSMGTVLIVEDDKLLAELIKLTLVRNGYDVQINEDDLLEETAIAGEGFEVKVKTENAALSEPMLQYHSPDEVPTLEEVKAWAIRKAYDACNHNISMTAKQLGLGRATLYRLIEKYGIDPERVADGNGAD